jgi:hypothetical protein
MVHLFPVVNAGSTRGIEGILQGGGLAYFRCVSVSYFFRLLLAERLLSVVVLTEISCGSAVLVECRVWWLC